MLTRLLWSDNSRHNLTLAPKSASYQEKHLTPSVLNRETASESKLLHLPEIPQPKPADQFDKHLIPNPNTNSKRIPKSQPQRTKNYNIFFPPATSKTYNPHSPAGPSTIKKHSQQPPYVDTPQLTHHSTALPVKLPPLQLPS